MRVRQRLSKLLLRHAIIDEDPRAAVERYRAALAPLDYRRAALLAACRAPIAGMGNP